MRRLFGSGSRPLTNRVSTPVLTYRNGSGATGGFSPAGRPAAYRSACGSTLDRVYPAGFASRTPAARPATNSM